MHAAANLSECKCNAILDSQNVPTIAKFIATILASDAKRQFSSL